MKDDLYSGFTWTRDGSGIVYSSARASSVLYLPTFNLWSAKIDGTGLRQLTFGEASYENPDLDGRGALVASRMVRDLNIWKFPVDGDPLDNVRHGAQVTRQTGQVQTPSLGANDREIVYLSDSGGHGNLWITDTSTGSSRQLTYELDPASSSAAGLVADGRDIVFYATRNGLGGNWLVNPDAAIRGRWCARWLGQLVKRRPVALLQREHAGLLLDRRPEEDPAQRRRERPRARRQGQSSGHLFRRDDVVLRGRAAGHHRRLGLRDPVASREPAVACLAQFQPAHPTVAIRASRDLARRQVARDAADRRLHDERLGVAHSRRTAAATDRFGQRPTYIARRVAWSPDGKLVYAALGEGDADIVLLRGLRRRLTPAVPRTTPRSHGFAESPQP